MSLGMLASEIAARAGRPPDIIAEITYDARPAGKGTAVPSGLRHPLRFPTLAGIDRDGHDAATVHFESAQHFVDRREVPRGVPVTAWMWLFLTSREFLSQHVTPGTPFDVCVGTLHFGQGRVLSVGW